MSALDFRFCSLGQAGTQNLCSPEFNEQATDSAHFDDASFADLNMFINTSGDTGLTVDPTAYTYPFVQQPTTMESSLSPASPTSTSSSYFESSMDCDSPESYSTSSSSTPALSESLLYIPQTSNPRVTLADECTDSPGSDSETASPPVSPGSVTAAAALCRAPIALHFRHPCSKPRSRRQRQGSSTKDLHCNGSNGIVAKEEAQDNSNGEDEEQEHKDEPQTSRAKTSRQPHFAVERRYRNTLNSEIRRLQMAVPHLAELSHTDGFRTGRPQPTKATIIASAVQYIKFMEMERDLLLSGTAVKKRRSPWQ